MAADEDAANLIVTAPIWIIWVGAVAYSYFTAATDRQLPQSTVQAPPISSPFSSLTSAWPSNTLNGARLLIIVLMAKSE